MPSYFCSSPDVKKKTQRSGFSKSRQFFSFILASFFLIIMFAFIVQINVLAATGFTIKSLEKEAVRLTEIQTELESSATTLKQQTAVKQSINVGEFVAVDKIEYIGTNEVGSGVAIVR